MCGSYERRLEKKGINSRPGKIDGKRERLREKMQITKTGRDEMDGNCSFGVACEADLPLCEQFKAVLCVSLL